MIVRQISEIKKRHVDEILRNINGNIPRKKKMRHFIGVTEPRSYSVWSVFYTNMSRHCFFMLIMYVPACVRPCVCACVCVIYVGFDSQYVSLPFSLSSYLPVFFIYPSIYLSIYLFIYLSTFLSIYLSIHLSIYIFSRT